MFNPQAPNEDLSQAAVLQRKCHVEQYLGIQPRAYVSCSTPTGQHVDCRERLTLLNGTDRRSP